MFWFWLAGNAPAQKCQSQPREISKLIKLECAWNEVCWIGMCARFTVKVNDIYVRVMRFLHRYNPSRRISPRSSSINLLLRQSAHIQKPHSLSPEMHLNFVLFIGLAVITTVIMATMAITPPSSRPTVILSNLLQQASYEETGDNKHYYLQRAHVAPANRYPIADERPEETLWWHGNLPPSFGHLYRNAELYSDE